MSQYFAKRIYTSVARRWKYLRRSQLDAGSVINVSPQAVGRMPKVLYEVNVYSDLSDV